MKKLNLPWRQIHMDFHTSELIAGVGSQFDAEEFADVLAKAHVGQVCCFARCHHGMIYYDSKRNPELVHPHLASRNMLKEQIAACHRRGIRVPIYTSVQFDHYTARRHADWITRSEDGSIFQKGFDTDSFRQWLCVNTPYFEWLKGHVQDIFECIPEVDGLFFDIVRAHDCSCRRCIEGMQTKGMDVTSKEERRKYGHEVAARFVLEMTRHVRQFSSDCTIYYNEGDIAPNRTDSLGGFTHLEFDALPSGSPDGYTSLRRRGRYERNLGLECVAMTGKFHTTWGDFHSFKNLASLEYECFQALSLNCRCLIGDQLPPSGRIERPVYELVGRVFAQVEQKESWCRGATALTDIAVLSGEGESMRGATGMLIEAGHQFEVLDNSMDISGFRLVILPDRLNMTDELAERIGRYVANGGSLLTSFEAGMDAAKKGFILKCLPVEFAGDGPIHTDGQPTRGRVIGDNCYADYIVPSGAIGKGLPATEHVMYHNGVEVRAAAGAEVLADVTQPLFWRTAEHFTSHRQTPSSGRPAYPAIIRKGSVIYFGHRVFAMYSEFAPLWVKKMVLNAVNLLLPEPLLRHDGPGTLETTVNRQALENRLVVHLLHYVPLPRAKKLCVIEDVMPLYDVRVSLRADVRPQKVRCVPDGENLDFDAKGGRLEFVVPKVNGHQMIEVSYKP
ncbi:MAG TPA: alpha-amylase family protein [Sedimentisphaerales bacterium]|nr:alpha-amylase family protein [Sedimentisphaerales bacterium]